MSEHVVFKSRRPGSTFVFESNKVVRFLGGEYSTSNETEIKELRGASESSGGLIYEETGVTGQRELTNLEKQAAASARLEALKSGKPV